MSGLAITQHGQPLAELVDVRLSADKKTLTLFLARGGANFFKRIDLRRAGAGLLAQSERTGSLVFARGVQDQTGEGAPFRRIVRTICGVFTARRELAEALVFLLWGQEMTLSNWPAPEGVQPASELLNAAD